jgi:transitional endoplasmic reticulum ATPase
MDASSLESLEQALAASPDNLALRTVVVRGWLTLGDARRASKHAMRTPASEIADEAARLDFGRALARAGEHELALDYLEGSPAGRLERARCLHALDRPADALADYRAAVLANPTLEDETFATLLRAKEPRAVRDRAAAAGPAGQAPPKLRVIANDDTDAAAVAKLTRPAAPRVTFADVGGLAEVKSEIHRRIVLPFQKPSLFDRFRKKAGGGVLLYGPPGCGKTLLARATAGECTATFFSVAISDILDMYIGESERKLHAIFEQARAKPPSVLFFDELEALAGKRKASRDGVAAKLVSQFLSEMDGFAQNNKGVLILGATNVPWEIDAAFRRPGRFDRVLFVPPPDADARGSIVELLLRDRPVATDVDPRFVAKQTSGFSGADLENVIETAADFAIEDSLEGGAETPISAEHVSRALRAVKPTTTEWLSSARNFARYANEGGQYDEVLQFLQKHGKA